MPHVFLYSCLAIVWMKTYLALSLLCQDSLGSVCAHIRVCVRTHTGGFFLTQGVKQATTASEWDSFYR